MDNHISANNERWLVSSNRPSKIPNKIFRSEKEATEWFEGLEDSLDEEVEARLPLSDFEEYQDVQIIISRISAMHTYYI